MPRQLVDGAALLLRSQSLPNTAADPEPEVPPILPPVRRRLRTARAWRRCTSTPRSTPGSWRRCGPAACGGAVCSGVDEWWQACHCALQAAHKWQSPRVLFLPARPKPYPFLPGPHPLHFTAGRAARHGAVAEDQEAGGAERARHAPDQAARLLRLPDRTRRGLRHDDRCGNTGGTQGSL